MAGRGFSSQLIMLDAFPKVSTRSQQIADPARSLLIYDVRLAQVSREFKTWASPFPFKYGVSSGEGLKDLSRFPGHVATLSRLAKDLSPRTMTVVAAGGGSVGDFAGFFASVYKRGVDLVHVPSTWLAAIDSSHGGKTALNTGGAKNQIGSFYPASRVALIRSLLMSQPHERVHDAMGELGKIAIIDGGNWVKSLEKSRLEGPDLLWKFLKPAIKAKLKVVAQDPQEKTGVRQVLNLGHTLGHVFEAAYGWTHGYSVAQGLFFSLEASLESDLLKPVEFERANRLLTEKLGLAIETPRRPLGAKRFLDLLLQDKKKTKRDEVTFIFVAGVGKAIRVPVRAPELLVEARRQGWVGSK